MSADGNLGDQAAEYQQRDNALALAFYRKPTGPIETGYCLHCGEELTHRRWCDSDCRDAWQLKQRR